MRCPKYPVVGFAGRSGNVSFEKLSWPLHRRLTIDRLLVPQILCSRMPQSASYRRLRLADVILELEPPFNPVDARIQAIEPPVDQGHVTMNAGDLAF